ncbi:hypothetical protein A5N72_11665 [Prescottella equi]|nr:hypothetical protein [Prescottella equi]ORM07002.1 hypothetical protein A5N72_11665 [Prescottella equi]
MRRLDGLHDTIASAYVGAWEVMVGGGPDRYVLTATGGAGVANALSCGRTGAEDDTVDLTVGGQAVDYPTRYVLSRAEAEEAVRDLGTGDLRAGRWERQSW